MASSETGKDVYLYPVTNIRQIRRRSPRATLGDLPSQKSVKSVNTFINSDVRSSISLLRGESLGNSAPEQSGHIVGQDSPSRLRSRHLVSQSVVSLQGRNQKVSEDQNGSKEKAVLPSSFLDSEPVRYAKRGRKTKTRGNQTDDSNISPTRPHNKHSRTLRRGHNVRDSKSLKGSPTSGLEDGKEIECKENIRSAPNQRSYLVVEIPVFDNFDRDAYARVSLSSSQSPDTVKTQERKESLSQAQSTSLAAIKKEVIPDSQDSLGSWNYISSVCETNGSVPAPTSRIINHTASSTELFATPELETAPSTSQTSSVPPSAQPNYIEYYSVDSQISYESSKSLTQSDYIRNKLQPTRSTTSTSEESQNLVAQRAERLVPDHSVLSNGSLEELLWKSPVTLQNYSPGRGYFSSSQEAVNISEQGSSREHIELNRPPKANSNQGSSDSWHAAQIVPISEFLISQNSIGDLVPNTNSDNHINSSKRRVPDFSNNSASNSEGIKTQRLVPHSTKISSEYPQRIAKRNDLPSASILEAEQKKSTVQRKATVEKYLHLSSEHSPQSNPREQLSGQGSTPKRPRTRSISSMADHENVGSSSQIDYAALLTAARDRARVKYDQSSSLDDFRNSPGVPISDIPSQMLPVRENVVAVPSSTSPMDDPSDDEESQNSPSNDTKIAPASALTERIVFLPLPSMVRDIYLTELKRNKSHIRAFLSDDNPKPKMVEQMNSMIEKLKMITDHQDLPYEELSSQQSLTDDQAVKWATTCSPKCLFLQHLLRRSRIQARDVAVVARSGRMLDILELILKEDHQIYNRLDRPGQSNARNIRGLTVTLIPSGMSDVQDFINRVDAVIAFDDTARRTAQFSNITERLDRGLSPPVISLIVAFSPGHIEMCLSPNMDPFDKTNSLVDYIVRTREALGQLSAEFLTPEQTAAVVAGTIPSIINGNAPWPLQQNLAIPGLGFPIDHKIEEPVVSTIQHKNPHASPKSTSMPHSSMKRTLRAEGIGEVNTDASKRMRMTPGPGDLASSEDVTRISDSIAGTQLKSSSAEAVKDAIVMVTKLDEEQSKQIASLLEKVNDLEKRLQSKQNKVDDLETTIERFKQNNRELEMRIHDLTRTIQNVQPKYRQAIADKDKAQADRDLAQSRAIKLSEVNNTRLEDIGKLKVEKTNLEGELTAARAALSNSSIPDAAKLVQIEDQLRELGADKERLEKRVASIQGNFEFTRDAYQKASSHLTELNGEINQLQEENKILRRQASDNKVHVAEIQRASEVRQREDRIEELEALLKDRERELAKKSEELKIKTNGRRETRGTSVPRSPRLGSGAMSPRPQFARTTGGSRGASPAPGEAREGFRDPPLFPPSGLGSARYSHLA